MRLLQCHKSAVGQPSTARTQHRPPRAASCAAAPVSAVFGSVSADRAFLPEQDPLTRRGRVPTEAHPPVVFRPPSRITPTLLAPHASPCPRLPKGLQAYEDALADLPNLALSSDLRGALEQWLPHFDLQELTPAHPAAAEAWQQHLQQPLPPANSAYTSPRQLHICQHEHIPVHLQPPAAAPAQQSQQQSQQQLQGLGEPGGVLLQQDPVLWRAYQVLSFLSHAYMWCAGPSIPTTLPSRLAQPWVTVSAALHMPPVLVYATYNLLNWRRLDCGRPVELGNLAVQQQFFGGVDEAWFRLVHVAIEAAAAPAIAALTPLQEAAAQRDAAGMEQHLLTVIAGLQSMQQLLDRMGEHCDPYIYYQRVRVPMSGWRNNPVLPDGLIYQGLWGDQPQQLYGETGAQSTIVPAFDAVLGIKHQAGWLQRYLCDMRAHMPPIHREYLAMLEAGPSVRTAIQDLTGALIIISSSSDDGSSGSSNWEAGGGGSSSNSSLVEVYDEAVSQLERFRAQHRGFAQRYIAQFSQKDTTGTGGSDFMPALTGYRQTTAGFKLAK